MGRTLSPLSRRGSPRPGLRNKLIRTGFVKGTTFSRDAKAGNDIDPVKIREVKVLKTWVGGKLTYDSDAASR